MTITDLYALAPSCCKSYQTARKRPVSPVVMYVLNAPGSDVSQSRLQKSIPLQKRNPVLHIQFQNLLAILPVVCGTTPEGNHHRQNDEPNDDKDLHTG
jgi:hypothetical protein